MARKKSGKPENNIIPFNQTGSLSNDDLMDDDFFDEDDEDGVDEEMVNQLMSTPTWTRKPVAKGKPSPATAKPSRACWTGISSKGGKSRGHVRQPV